MTISRRVLLLLLIASALLWQGCSDRRGTALRQLKKVGAERLRLDAALIYKDMFARHGRPDFIEVWYKDWPPSFQKFSPIHVGAYIDGFTIALETGRQGEAGIFVIPATMEHEPATAHGISYQRITEGIYWYSFGTTRQ